MRYVKNHSNYILRSKHQNTNNGGIFERDWVTIGAKQRYLTWDKRTSYHGDGNFVFTTSNIPSFQRKYKSSDWLGKWQYDDVKNSSDENNKIKIEYKSNTIRDFAYYGSAVELVRSSVESIISKFPSYLDIKYTQIIDDNESFITVPQTLSDSEEFENAANPSVNYDALGLNHYYIVNNPFNLDFWHTDVKVDTDEEFLKFLALSYQYYVVSTGDEFEDILEKPLVEYVKEDNCKYKIDVLWSVTIKTVSTEIHFYGIEYYGKLYFVCDNPDFKLYPKKETIDGFFDKLDGFEETLMTRNSLPVYKNTFVLYRHTDSGLIRLNRDYIWPSYSSININYGGEMYKFTPIDISTPSFKTFLNELYQNAKILDEIYCDNIWNRMVHESIKNYDWSYKRELDINAVEENIAGGQLLERLLRIYGRGFDNIKRAVDIMKNNNNITYDGVNNLPISEISDKLDAIGLSVYSTIPVLDDEVLDTLPLGKELGYKGYATENLTPAFIDNEFAKRLMLNSRKILASKGTIEAIDMVMGMFGFGRDKGAIDGEGNPKYDDNGYEMGAYSIREEYRTTTLKPIESTYLYYNGRNDYILKVKNAITDEGGGYLDLYDEYGNNKIEEINKDKYDMRLYYPNDIYSGIPLREIYVREQCEIEGENGEKEIVFMNHRLLAPYYNHKQRYDSGVYRFKELYFQSNGGWGKFDDDDIFDSVDYSETLNYTKIYGTINELFTNNDILTNDIVYVIDTSGYCEYFNNNIGCPPKSHYFVCVDSVSYTNTDGWKSVDEFEVYKTADPEKYGDEFKKYEYVLRAKYLDSLINDNTDNNPHVGYGHYDMGDMYWEYLSQPFTYALKNHRLDRHVDIYGNPDQIIKDIEFNVKNVVIVERNNLDNHHSYRDNPEMFKSRMLNWYYLDNTYKDNIAKQKYKEYTIDDNNKTDDEIKTSQYALNSKVITFVNNIDNVYYKRYFRNVIMKYLMQVIPSTAILRFEGLSLDSVSIGKCETCKNVEFVYIGNNRKLVYNGEGEFVGVYDKKTNNLIEENKPTITCTFTIACSEGDEVGVVNEFDIDYTNGCDFISSARILPDSTLELVLLDASAPQYHGDIDDNYVIEIPEMEGVRSGYITIKPIIYNNCSEKEDAKSIQIEIEQNFDI